MRVRGSCQRALFLCGACLLGAAKAASPSRFESAHPFRSVGKWLIASNDDKTDVESPSMSVGSNEAAVKRALLMMSKTQLIAKGTDGAAHALSSRAGGAAARSNVTAEIEKLHVVFSENATGARPSVAAAKLVHKGRTCQGGLRAAELVELAAAAHAKVLGANTAGKDGTGAPLEGDEEWAAAAEAAGVTLLRGPVCVEVPEGRHSSGRAGEVCALVLRSDRGEVIVAICDDLGGEGMVRALARAPVPCLQPCRSSLPNLQSAATAGSGRDHTGRATGSETALVSGAVLRAAEALVAALPSAGVVGSEGSDTEGSRAEGAEGGRALLPSSFDVHCVGHSFAGSVAAVLTAILDGTLVPDGGSREGGGAVSFQEAVRSASCVALGPCPCVGSSVALPGCASVVLGDDLFARLQPSSLRRLRARVLSLLHNGGATGAARVGSAWLGDALSSTVRNVRGALDARKKQGSSSPTGGSGGEMGAAEGGDALALLCPGVVYLLKPRSSGAVGVTTTKRGGLGEAVFSTMHEALLSKSMLAHHALGAYIHALDAV